MTYRMTRRSAGAVLVASLLVAGCGEQGGQDESGAPADEATAAGETATKPTVENAEAPEYGPAFDLAGALDLPEPGAPGWPEAQARYLEAFAGQTGVERTDSGVLYAVLDAGEGVRPESGQTVKVHYEGRLVTGQVFDSSYARGEPVDLATDRVIQGWQDILPLMKEGGTWQVAIPAELAYGDRTVGDGRIPPGSALVFTIELLAVAG